MSAATRAARMLVAATALAALAACSEPDGPGASGAIRLSLRVDGLLAGETLVIAPHYRRADQSIVPFEAVSVPIGSNTSQEVPLALDVSSCLADGARERTGIGCPVRIAIALRSVQGSTVDSQLVGPLDAVPGGTIRTAPVTLRAVGSLALTGGRDTVAVGETTVLQGEVRDRRGGTIAGRAVRFRSANPAVASASAGGAVTGVAPGVARIVAAVVDDSSVTASRDVVVRGVLAVSIAPDSLTLDVDQSATPGASVSAIGVPATVRWSSAAPAIATVDVATGRITALAPGRAVIRAEATADPAKRDSVVVLVRGVISVVVSPPTLTLDPGQTAPATATVTATGGAATTVSWQSRNQGVATVSATGVVTAVAGGVTAVVATSTADPTQADSTMVTVRGVTSVNIVPDTVTLSAGQGASPTVTVAASPGTSTALTWQTSDASVATVQPTTGLVTAVATGVAVITARAVADPTKFDTMVLQVRGVLSVAAAPDSAWMDPGDTTTPAVVVTAVAVSQAVVWVSSNPAVATVSSAGLVTALSPGRTVITVRSAVDATKRDSIPVNVVVNWTGALRLVGDAAVVAGGVNLTPAAANRAGAAWAYPKRPLANGFVVSYEFTITGVGGTPDGLGAPGGEGYAFVIQNSDSMALGQGGSGLGYEGIPRSLAIEFDLYSNPGLGDPNNNHISVHTRGLAGNSASHVFSLGSGIVPFDMSTGSTVDVTITYQPGSLRIDLSSFFTLTVPVDLTNVGGANLLDAAGKAWVGFTGSTGPAFERHNILFYTLP